MEVIERFEPAMPLENLVESHLNTRKRFNAGKLQELADSIREKGIITPLLARPLGVKFEIAAGHRRYRAAGLAGRETVPVVIRELGDDEFLEILTVENLQREDVHPLEEAEGYAELLGRPGYDATSLAAKIGKSESYVVQRLKLLDLVPTLKEDFLQEKIQFSHALLLARLQGKDQEELRKHGLYERFGAAISAAELRDEIQRSVYLDLLKVPWDTFDKTLVPGAGSCVGCSKRTGFRASLFPEIEKQDFCLDRACYHRKSKALVTLRLSTVEKEAGVAPLKVSTKHEWDKKARQPGILYDNEWQPMQDTVEKGVEKRCGNTAVAVLVELGPHGTQKLKLGQRLEVCTKTSCPVHFRQYGRAAKADTPAEKLKELQSKRSIETDQVTEERLLETFLHRVTWPLAIDDLRRVVWGCWSRLWHDARVVVLKRRKIERPNVGMDSAEALRPFIATAAADDLAALLYEIALYGSRDVFEPQGGDADITYSASEFIEDALTAGTVQEVRAAVVAEIAAKFNAKEAKLRQSPAAKKAVAAKKAAKKKAVKK